MPENHRFVKGIKPSWLIFKGGEIGPSVAEAIKIVLKARQHPEQGYKSSMGILQLARKFSPERAEKACQRALYFKGVSYKSIKTILEKSLDTQPFGEDPQANPAAPPTFHDNLRGSQYYAQAKVGG
jgi:hypothetical protein